MRAHPKLFMILKDGSLLPVVILRFLNQFMANHHFKMEGICRVKELLRGDWTCSVDLKTCTFLQASQGSYGKTPPTNSHVYCLVSAVHR